MRPLFKDAFKDNLRKHPLQSVFMHLFGMSTYFFEDGYKQKSFVCQLNNRYQSKLNFVALEFLFIYKVAASTPVVMEPGDRQQSINDGQCLRCKEPCL
jgi:hypothetical protein